VPFDPAAENELVVTCRAPDDRYGGIHDTDRVPESVSVPGVWWDAAVTTHPETFVVDVNVSPQVTDDGAGVVVANGLRDTGDAGTGVYDRGGDPKRAVEALATAFEPVRAILAEPGPGDAGVVLVNDTSERVEGTLRWTAVDDGGELDVTVGPAGRTVAGRLDVPDDAAAVTLELTIGDRSVRTEHRL